MYIHWSSKRVQLVHTHKNVNTHGYKPEGLWFDVDRDWERWCRSEDFRIGSLSVSHVVEFDPSRVLFLKSAGDIDRFTEKYGKQGSFRIDISWKLLAEDYAGIVISPYCWERRLTEHTFWYYGFDCACGCIWDLSIITKFEPITLPVFCTGSEENKCQNQS